MSRTTKLLNKAMNSIDGNKKGMDEVIGDIEEAIWSFEALLNSAELLREAQIAYMADRGNDALGQAVAERARELDAVLELEEVE